MPLGVDSCMLMIIRFKLTNSTIDNLSAQAEKTRFLFDVVQKFHVSIERYRPHIHCNLHVYHESFFVLPIRIRLNVCDIEANRRCYLIA